MPSLPPTRAPPPPTHPNRLDAGAIVCPCWGVKVTKRQRSGLVLLALGLCALAVDRLVLQPGALGPKQAAASDGAIVPAVPVAKAQAQSRLLSVAALIDLVPEGKNANDSLDSLFSDPAWARPALNAAAKSDAATTDDQGKAHAITGVIWGRAASIILDDELLKTGQAGKSGRVLVRLDEARNTAIVRINGRETELVIPDSMRPSRERPAVPSVTPTTGGNHPQASGPGRGQ